MALLVLAILQWGVTLKHVYNCRLIFLQHSFNVPLAKCQIPYTFAGVRCPSLESSWRNMAKFQHFSWSMQQVKLGKLSFLENSKWSSLRFWHHFSTKATNYPCTVYVLIYIYIYYISLISGGQPRPQALASGSTFSWQGRSLGPSCVRKKAVSPFPRSMQL